MGLEIWRLEIESFEIDGLREGEIWKSSSGARQREIVGFRELEIEIWKRDLEGRTVFRDEYIKKLLRVTFTTCKFRARSDLLSSYFGEKSNALKC